MSLIHEALKKAEQQRRLGEPPGLATPFARSPRQRSLLPYLAAAIAVALGAGWFLMRDTAVPANDAAAKTDRRTAASTPAAGGATSAVSGTDPASASSAAEHRPTVGANAAASAPVATTLAPPPRLNNQAPPPANPPTLREVAERESEPHPPGVNPPLPGEAMPLAPGAAPPETPVSETAGLASTMAAAEKGRGVDAAPPMPDPGGSPFISDRPGLPPAHTAKSPGPATPTGAPTPAPPGATAGFVPPKADATTVPPPLAPPLNTLTTAAAPPTATPAETPPLEQLPVYWQLPYNVRKELPDLKMSMHVYSETPTQRFVVLNGNRQVEGDELGGDVRVSEIRKDGVVLVFRGQRFIVPRGGS